MLLILAVLFLCSNSCSSYFNLAGPYEATMVDLHECEDVGTHQHEFKFKIKKVNATTRLILANVSYLVEVNEKVSMKVTSAMWTSGGWGNNAFNKDFEYFCGTWRDYMPETLEAWCIALGIPIECPIAAGSYSTQRGMAVTFPPLKKFPVLPYGRYKAQLAFYNGETRIGCIALVGDIDEIATTKMIG